MKPLFEDPARQAEFDRQGFVVSRLLSSKQVERLADLYRRSFRQAEVSGLYESSRHNPYELNRSLNEAIRDEVARAGRHLFAPSKLYGGSFMVKSRHDSEFLPLHQDWSVIDERAFSTLFVWCPLLDVTVENGCLFVLPGSHRYFESLRSGSYSSDRFVLPPELHRHTCDVPLAAGEAILYSDRLFHGSYANNGPRDRVVVTARVLEEGAELVYFHRADERHVDLYRADEKFYLSHIDDLARGRMPAGVPRIDRRPYRHVTVTDQALQKEIRERFEAPEEATTMRLFREAKHQEEFEREGYVVIDLLDRDGVEELAAFYDGLDRAAVSNHGFRVSLDDESPVFVRTVSSKIIEVARPGLDEHFENHQLFTASFVTKEKDPLGVVPPHQDWTFVDETRFLSATVWCPLVDVDTENGALGLIRGSHRFYDHVRPSPSPQFAPPFTDQLFSIFPYLDMVDLSAGQALVFDNRTLHASPPNTTDGLRLAFGVGIAHADARLRHYYLLPGRDEPLVEGYEVTPEFFYEYNNARLSALHRAGERPRDLNSLGVFSLTARRYETDRLVERIEAAGNTRNEALVEKMTALFAGHPHATPAGGANPAAGETAAKLPFWKVYTPINIVREIRHRLSGR